MKHRESADSKVGRDVARQKGVLRMIWKLVFALAPAIVATASPIAHAVMVAALTEATYDGVSTFLMIEKEVC